MKLIGMCLFSLCLVAPTLAQRKLADPSPPYQPVVCALGGYVPKHYDIVCTSGKAILKDGTRLGLYVVRLATGEVFNVDGTKANVSRNLGTRSPSQKNETGIALKCDSRGWGLEPSASFRYLSVATSDGMGSAYSMNKSRAWFEIDTGLENNKSADVGIGFADGAWRTVATYDVPGNRSSDPKFAPIVMPIRSYFEKNGSKISGGKIGDGFTVIVDPLLSEADSSEAMRLAVYDKQGALICDAYEMRHDIPAKRDANGFPVGWSKDWKPKTDSILNVEARIGDISRVELQERPYTWILFKNVRLESQG